MDKQHILDEIVRTASENNGIALGVRRFYRETGIKESDWSGKYWARWSDAVKEAGCTVNSWQAPIPEAKLLGLYIGLIRELGRIPVDAELKIKAKQDEEFPSDKPFRRFGDKGGLIKAVKEFCGGKEEYKDIQKIVSSFVTADVIESNTGGLPTNETFGFVYLIKSNKFYKIGRSNSLDRRCRELAIQLPEKVGLVHSIKTDDPIGIELYWHRRFESKRKNGEWFELNAEDVKAFKRRKFM